MPIQLSRKFRRSTARCRPGGGCNRKQSVLESDMQFEDSVADMSQCAKRLTMSDSNAPLPLPSVPSYFVWSICSVCYFLPLGIVALFFSFACKRDLSAGHRGSAITKSKIAFYCNVISLIGALVLLITLALLLTYEGGHRGGHNLTRAFSFVKLLSRGVEAYTLDVTQPPTTEQGLRALMALPPDLPPEKWGGPYLREGVSLLDPWGNEYRYACPGRDGRPFDIWSIGLDGIDGTDDDIGHWMNFMTVGKRYRRYR